MKIVITGSAGFIGSSLCHWIINNTEHEVIGVDNFSSGYHENLPKHQRFVFEYCDIVKQDLNRVFAKYNPNICFHLACYAAEGRSNYIRSFIHSNNTVGTANVINCCVNYDCKLIFTSSVAVYSGTPPFTEETIPNPIDEYGLSKLTSEKSIQISGEQQGLDWCIIRPRNVYGVRQALTDPSRNVMGIWMNQILNNKPMTVYGDGEQLRNFTYIDDILEPLYNAIKIEKQVINLGSEKAYTVMAVANILRFISGYDNIVHLDARHEVREATCLSEKARQLLNYHDRTRLIEGVKKMWNWAKSQPRKEMQTPPKLETNKHAHSSLIA